MQPPKPNPQQQAPQQPQEPPVPRPRLTAINEASVEPQVESVSQELRRLTLAIRRIEEKVGATAKADDVIRLTDALLVCSCSLSFLLVFVLQICI